MLVVFFCFLVSCGCGCRILRENLGVGCGCIDVGSSCDVGYRSCDVGSCYVVKCCLYLSVCVGRWMLDRYMCICDCVVHVRCCNFAVIFHHPATMFFPLLLPDGVWSGSPIPVRPPSGKSHCARDPPSVPLSRFLNGMC
jgi:hypothetical protein